MIIMIYQELQLERREVRNEGGGRCAESKAR